MSAASMKANEPSMEEILASIRRIIADDTSKKPEATPAVEPAAEESVDDADDVLDLATVPAASTPPNAFANKSLADEIEFREIIVPDIEPVPEPEAEPVAEDVVKFEPVQEPIEAPPPPAGAAQPTEPETLLSAAANASVSQAFGALGSLMINQNAMTLEDLVKDLMRPMLKSWLDDNLPALVERLVRAEIERVSRGPRP